MAVYNCECGLIISTSSDRPQCLRCHRVLGAKDLAERRALPALLAMSPLADPEPHVHFRQVTMGYRLNERPVLVPIVRPK